MEKLVLVENSALSYAEQVLYAMAQKHYRASDEARTFQMRDVHWRVGNVFYDAMDDLYFRLNGQHRED